MVIGLTELIAQQSRDGAFGGSNTFQTSLMDSYTLQFWQDKGLTFPFISHMQNGLGSSITVFYMLPGVLRAM